MEMKKIRGLILTVFILCVVFNLRGERLRAQAYDGTIKEAVTTHYDRGRDYFCKKDYLAAKDEFEKVLSLDAEHSGAQWYLSVVKKELGRRQKSFWNCLEGTKVIKAQENKHKKAKEDVEDMLTFVEKGHTVEQADDSNRQIKKGKAALIKQKGKYEAEADNAFEHERLAVQKAARLEQANQRLEADIEEYKRMLKQQAASPQSNASRQEVSRLRQMEREKEELTAQVKRLQQEQARQMQADQEELARLKQAEAEKEKLAGRINQMRGEQKNYLQERLTEYQRKLNEYQQTLGGYKQTLQKKFDEKTVQLSRKLTEYENRLAQMEQEKKALEQRKENTSAQQLEVKQVEAERGRLEAELRAVQQAQQAQLNEELKRYESAFQKYELSLRNNFEQKIDELNEKIAAYEDKLQGMAEQKKAAEDNVSRSKDKQIQAVRKAEEEKLQLELKKLRRQQEACLQEELKKYEQALETKVAQKERELEEKIRSFEQRSKEQSSKQEPVSKEHDPLHYAESKLLNLQMELNKQLQAELEKYKKEKAQPFYEQGIRYIKEKKYEAARENLEKTLAACPNYPEAEDALETIEKLEKVEFHLAEGRRNFKEGGYVKAKEEFEQVLALDYKNSGARDYIRKIEETIRKEEQEKALAEERAECLRQKLVKEEKLRQEAKAREEERRRAEEARRARLQAEREERQGAEQAAREQRAREAKLKAEEARKAEDARQARLQAEREERQGAEQAAREQRAQEAKLKAEEARKAEDARQARSKAQKLAEEKSLREAVQRQKEEEYCLSMLNLAKLKAEQEVQRRKQTEQQKIKKDIQPHFVQGKKLYSQREYAQAIETFKRVLVIDAKNALAEKYITNCQAAMAKQQQEAKQKAEEARAAETARLARLEAEREERQRAEEAERERRAEEFRQKAEEKKKIELYFAQGKINFYRKQYEQAIEEFAGILLLQPEHPAAEKFIQRCQQALEEQRQEALQVKEEKAGKLEKVARVIKEDEEKEKLEKIQELYQKGKNFYRCGLYSEAITCFEKVVELEGNPRIHYTPQAQEYIEKSKGKIEGEKKEAAQQIAEEEVKRIKSAQEKELSAELRMQQQALREKEEAVRSHYKLGKNYYAQGSYPLSIAEFNKIKEIAPDHLYTADAEKYIQKAQQRIMEKEERELKAEMRRQGPAVKGEVTAGNLLEQARWYYKRGDYRETVKICRAALELDPLNKDARSLLYKADVRQIRHQGKRANKEKAIDEREMMVDVAQTQVLPVERTMKIKEKEFVPFVKVPAAKEKLKSPVTVDFRDVDLSYVLSFLANSTGVNVIPASEVSLEGKKVTIKMKDIPAEKALKYILKNQGLVYRLEEDVVWVASAGEMDKEQVESRVYFLNRGSGMFTEFARAVATGTGLGGAATISKITTIEDILKEAVNWPQNSKLVLDERSGALIISNTPSNLQIIEDILYNLDITPVQVLIEARFVELEITDIKQLGIEWQITEDMAGGNRYQGQNATQFESGAGWDFTTFNRSAEGLNLTYTGVLTYPQFQMVLHALSESQDAKTLSAPRVTTLNNQMASIKVVDEWIYPTKYEFQVVQSDVNGDGDFDDANETKYQNVPVDFVTKDVGILLHVTPNVGADTKTITLALIPEVSSGTAGYFSYTGSVSLPLFTSRTLSTSVVINNGETVALGGLVKETTTKTKTKIPILGDVPILGNLFRKSSDSVVRKNLLIFVTASIISPSGEKIETVRQ